MQTGGTRPSNVLIRITLPGQEFASKFGRAPEEHYFPLAGVGFNSCVAVSVRSLPRSGAHLDSLVYRGRMYSQEKCRKFVRLILKICGLI